MHRAQMEPIGIFISIFNTYDTIGFWSRIRTYTNYDCRLHIRLDMAGAFSYSKAIRTWYVGAIDLYLTLERGFVKRVTNKNKQFLEDT